MQATTSPAHAPWSSPASGKRGAYVAPSERGHGHDRIDIREGGDRLPQIAPLPRAPRQADAPVGARAGW
jgi:hypothetical protein